MSLGTFEIGVNLECLKNQETNVAAEGRVRESGGNEEVQIETTRGNRGKEDTETKRGRGGREVGRTTLKQQERDTEKD